MDDKNYSVPGAHEALRRLREGNRRFISDRAITHVMADSERLELAQSQHPFAIILGCSDSRVPAELVFDQGLGDLFVIRVAGNIVAPSQIGSVEFAAAKFGTELVVVMGHSNCGVIHAAVHHLRHEPGLESSSMSSIVDRVTPAVSPLLDIYPDDDKALIEAATRSNVMASVEQLRSSSSILARLEEKGRLMIVGAHCSLETGEVVFYA